MNLWVREMNLKINIVSQNTEAFSDRTMNAPKLPFNHSQDIWNFSRHIYSRARKDVKAKIFGTESAVIKTMEVLKSDGDFN